MVNEKKFELCDVLDEIKKITYPSTANVRNAEFARKCYPFCECGEGQFIAVLKNLNKNENMKQKY